MGAWQMMAVVRCAAWKCSRMRPSSLLSFRSSSGAWPATMPRRQTLGCSFLQTLPSHAHILHFTGSLLLHPWCTPMTLTQIINGPCVKVLQEGAARIINERVRGFACRVL